MKIKNEKGFTLLELIAVLVIMAIIALIVTPLVMNIIKKAKESANERSVDAYGRSVEIAIAKYVLETKEFPLTFDSLDVSYSGNEVECDIIELYDDGSIYLSKCSVKDTLVKDSSTDDGYYHYGKKKSESNADTDIVEPSVVTEKFENGQAVYYNPELNKKCNESEAVSTTGTKTGCMKWYAINDVEGNEEVNLILDHNTTALVAWNSSNTITSMAEISDKLKSDSKTWNSELNVRIITANEIAKITGNSNFDEENKDAGCWFYFDTNNQNKVANASNKSKYAYLFDNTSNCLENGCNIEDNNSYLYDSNSTNIILGYWTSSSVYNTNDKAWFVEKNGYLNNDYVKNSYDYGIRPVITVKKYIIK